jgi:putative ABC transport system permease protein
VDGIVLAFTLSVCVVVAMACGLAPAFRGARGAVRVGLNESGRGASRGKGVRRFHGTLVVAELAFALVLVASAGLLVNSFSRIIAVNPGFRTHDLVRVKISLPSSAYPTAAKRNRFTEDLLHQGAALPGVRSAGMVSRFPLSGSHLTTNVVVDGAAYNEGIQLPTAEYRTASAGYFSTMGIPVLAGREFQSSDNIDSTAARVMIVNRAAAIQLLGGVNVVGKRVKLGGPERPPITVVGVVGDTRDATLRELPTPMVYISTQQAGTSDVSLVVRYEGSPESVVKGIRTIVASLDSSLPVFSVQTIDDIVRTASVSDRFITTVLSSFALLALVLASLGTYGVIAYGVSARTREIGVRMALGARASEVAAMVLREGMILFAIALPIALAATWWASRTLSGLLFGVSALDPSTIGASVVTLAVVTGLATLIPARRAARVDPTIAMRGSGA